MKTKWDQTYVAGVHSLKKVCRVFRKVNQEESKNNHEHQWYEGDSPKGLSKPRGKRFKT